MGNSRRLNCLFLISDGSSEWFTICFRCQGTQVAELTFRCKRVGARGGGGCGLGVTMTESIFFLRAARFMVGWFHMEDRPFFPVTPTNYSYFRSSQPGRK